MTLDSLVGVADRTHDLTLADCPGHELLRREALVSGHRVRGCSFGGVATAAVLGMVKAITASDVWLDLL